MTFPDRAVVAELGLTEDLVRRILGSPEDAARMLEQAKAVANFRFRVLVQRAHPDCGGNAEPGRIASLKAARDYIRSLEVVTESKGVLAL